MSIISASLNPGYAHVLQQMAGGELDATQQTFAAKRRPNMIPNTNLSRKGVLPHRSCRMSQARHGLRVHLFPKKPIPLWTIVHYPHWRCQCLRIPVAQMIVTNRVPKLTAMWVFKECIAILATAAPCLAFLLQLVYPTTLAPLSLQRLRLLEDRISPPSCITKCQPILPIFCTIPSPYSLNPHSIFCLFLNTRKCFWILLARVLLVRLFTLCRPRTKIKVSILVKP